ncbi:MAG: hypothetical protein LHW41_03440 [Candidatus Cloacimonetes bacterium]|nr:hypothetical protein [Candidatus Cloacimonadota bacterium]
MMQHRGRSFESQYRNWLACFGEEGLDFDVILKRIWSFMSPEGRAMNAEDLNYLVCYVSRVRKAQGDLIRRVCEERNQDYWKSLNSRASCLFQRIHIHAEKIAAQLRAQVQEQWNRYFYRVLEYNLLRCNKEELADLLPQNQDRRHFSPLSKVQGSFQSLPELLNKIAIRKEATQLYLWMLESWKPSHLNVFCHYYETLYEIPTQRLADESQANIDQLHSRLRRRIQTMQEDRKIDADVMRVFCKICMEKMCQDVPASRTYKYTEGKQ